MICMRDLAVSPTPTFAVAQAVMQSPQPSHLAASKAMVL
jgi:hypothetical protein